MRYLNSQVCTFDARKYLTRCVSTDSLRWVVDTVRCVVWQRPLRPASCWLVSAHWTSTGTPPRSDIQVRERQTSQTDRSDSVTVQKESYSRTDSLIVIMCVRQVCPTCPPPLREYVLLQAAEESDTSKEPNTLDTTGTCLIQNTTVNSLTYTYTIPHTTIAGTFTLLSVTETGLTNHRYLLHKEITSTFLTRPTDPWPKIW